MDWTNQINIIASTLTNAEEHWKELGEDLNNINNRLCDLEHKIENDNFNACEGYKLAKQLKEIRQERRKIKNEIAQLEPLYNYLQNHKQINIDMFKVKTQIDKIDYQQKNWAYKSRAKEGEAR